MTLSGSSIAIVFIGVVAYAAAGPVQAVPNTLQQNEYGGLADLLARYWEDRRMTQDAKRNWDQIGSGHLVRNTDKQFKNLLNEEKSGSTQYLNSASDKYREGLFTNQFRNGNLINSSINPVALANTISHPYRPNLNAAQSNNQQLFMDQFINHDVSNNARESDKQIVKNLDQIDGEYLVRNLEQINGRHLVRNLDQIGGGHLVRNLDQIGGGHLVRNLDQIGGGHLVRNLDQIGGGNLVRNLDQIGGGNLIRSIDYSNAEMKRHVDQSASNLNQIGNLLRNLDQIGGGNLVRNLDQISGGNLVRSLK